MKFKPNFSVHVSSGNFAVLLFTFVHAALLPFSVSAATWQWDGGAGTGDWQAANNWNPNALNPNFNGTFGDRLNVNGAQALIYTSAEGTTNYGASGVRGLVVGSGTNGTMTITGGTITSLILNSAIATANLNGGTLTANSITHIGTTGNFNFDGGTLKAGQTKRLFRAWQPGLGRHSRTPHHPDRQPRTTRSVSSPPLIRIPSSVFHPNSRIP